MLLRPASMDDTKVDAVVYTGINSLIRVNWFRVFSRVLFSSCGQMFCHFFFFFDLSGRFYHYSALLIGENDHDETRVVCPSIISLLQLSTTS